jgi:hypothetical protein
MGWNYFSLGTNEGDEHGETQTQARLLAGFTLERRRLAGAVS